MNWDNVHATKKGADYPDTELVRFMARNYYKQDRSKVKAIALGCGDGANVWYMFREGFWCFGVDNSIVACRKALNKLQEFYPDSASAIWLRDNLEFLQVSENESADVIFDIESVYTHSYDEAKAVYAECARVLKTGGRLFIKTFADGTSPDLLDPTNMRFTKKDEVTDLLGSLTVLHCDLHTRTVGPRIIKEWVIEALK
jgi:SAM-dependent methyltransferase